MDTFLDRVDGQVVKRTGHYDTNQMENKLTGRYRVRTQLILFTSFQFFTSSAMSQKPQFIGVI